jgi:hypothetical protein
MQPPVRLCCGTSHRDVLCPDGKVMCCICFSRFDVSELHEIDGGHEDVCTECYDREQEVMRLIEEGKWVSRVS